MEMFSSKKSFENLYREIFFRFYVPQTQYQVSAHGGVTTIEAHVVIYTLWASKRETDRQREGESEAETDTESLEAVYLGDVYVLENRIVV